jgi:hypothetical protein
MTCQIKKKKPFGNLKANLSAFTIRMACVVCVEEGKRSDIDSHAYCCVCGKEVFLFNYIDREVTVTGWYPEGETKSLRIVSAPLGYTIP